MKKPKIKRGGIFLYLVTIAVFLPALASSLMAWVGYNALFNSLEKTASAYVNSLARSTAAQLRGPKWDIYGNSDSILKFRNPLSGDPANSRIFNDDDLMPGTFLITDKYGNTIFSADPYGVLHVQKQQMTPFPPTTLKFNRDRWTVVLTEVPNKNLFIVAAVKWTDIVGKMTDVVVVWSCIMGLLGLCGVFGVYLMWQKVLRPLKDLEEDIAETEWGVDVPNENEPKAVYEIQNLRKTIAALAEEAVDKSELSQRYATDIVRVQEEERAKIARDLHDGPLQDITALIQRIRLLSIDNGSEEEITKKLSDAENVGMAGVRELREICNNLTPPWLELGLPQALTELTDRMSNQFNVQILLDTEEIPEISETETLAFFRVVQEAINNAVSHGGATQISVTLREENGEIRLTTEDNGSGFDVPENMALLRIKGHRGLSNMYERMRLIGGTIEIKSEKGEGTVIRCAAKVKKPTVSDKAESENSD